VNPRAVVEPVETIFNTNLPAFPQRFATVGARRFGFICLPPFRYAFTALRLLNDRQAVWICVPASHFDTPSLRYGYSMTGRQVQTVAEI